MWAFDKRTAKKEPNNSSLVVHESDDELYKPETIEANTNHINNSIVKYA